MMRPLVVLLGALFCQPVIAVDLTADSNHGKALSEKDFQGCWFFSGTEGQPEVTTQGITNRADDGTYGIRFVTITPDGQLAYNNEAGYWAINNRRYLTITTSVGGEGANFAEVYDVLATDGNHLSYRHIASGNLYQAERVSCDTRLPRKS